MLETIEIALLIVVLVGLLVAVVIGWGSLDQRSFPVAKCKAATRPAKFRQQAATLQKMHDKNGPHAARLAQLQRILVAMADQIDAGVLPASLAPLNGWVAVE